MDAVPARSPHAHRHARRRVLPRSVAIGTTGLVAAVVVTGVLSASTGPAAGQQPAGIPRPVVPGPLSVPIPEPIPETGRGPAPVTITGPDWTRSLPKDTTQALRTVRTNRWCTQVWCTRTEAWQRVEGTWQIATRKNGADAVFRSQVGERGFAPAGQRRRGDMRTPSGVYGIATTFSTAKDRPTEMPWRRRLPTSVVSDAPGRTYNTWLEVRGSDYGDRRMMSWGFWIDYNNPRLKPGQGERPKPHLGSGIFAHTSNPGAPFVPTAGCIQLGDPADMEWVVRWLDPDANPRVVHNR